MIPNGIFIPRMSKDYDEDFVSKHLKDVLGNVWSVMFYPLRNKNYKKAYVYFKNYIGINEPDQMAYCLAQGETIKLMIRSDEYWWLMRNESKRYNIPSMNITIQGMAAIVAGDMEKTRSSIEKVASIVDDIKYRLWGRSIYAKEDPRRRDDDPDENSFAQIEKSLRIRDEIIEDQKRYIYHLHKLQEKQEMQIEEQQKQIEKIWKEMEMHSKAIYDRHDDEIYDLKTQLKALEKKVDAKHRGKYLDRVVPSEGTSFLEWSP